MSSQIIWEFIFGFIKDQMFLQITIVKVNNYS